MTPTHTPTHTVVYCNKNTLGVILHIFLKFLLKGTAYSYHVITFGMYVDVLLRKADPKHRNVDQIFREEIATPFGKLGGGGFCIVIIFKNNTRGVFKYR